jgi:hypothetical protein
MDGERRHHRRTGSNAAGALRLLLAMYSACLVCLLVW